MRNLLYLLLALSMYATSAYSKPQVDAINDMRDIIVKSPMEIAAGNVPSHSFIHKFGEAGDIDTADGVVDIWDGATDTIAGFTKTPTYTYSTTADIDSISSSDNSDTVDIEIQGLDSDWNLVNQTITLTGQTRAALTTNLIRVFRVKNVGATALAGNVFVYKNGGLTAGVPDTEADVRAIMQIGNEQTLMNLYTIPNGKSGYLCRFSASMSRRATQNSNIEMRFRQNGGVFQLKNRQSVMAAGTSHENHAYAIPESGLPEKTDIALRADSSANNGAISGSFDIVLVDD